MVEKKFLTIYVYSVSPLLLRLAIKSLRLMEMSYVRVCVFLMSDVCDYLYIESTTCIYRVMIA